MARCYNAGMPQRQPVLWLVSDARNDGVLETALARLPRGSGLIFRHRHLPEARRRARFIVLQRLARQFGHDIVLAGDARQARRWGADGAYGPAALLARGPAVHRFVTVHSLAELGKVRRADIVVLSPVFPTRSHPGGKLLGPLRFRLLAARARVPVIALGGMTRRRAVRLKTGHWAAIDGLSR
jgi:thiamine-phosphate pyrophosphorylase